MSSIKAKSLVRPCTHRQSRSVVPEGSRVRTKKLQLIYWDVAEASNIGIGLAFNWIDVEGHEFLQSEVLDVCCWL